MKKALALVLVLVSMALFAGAAFAGNVGDIGGLPLITVCSHRTLAQ